MLLMALCQVMLPHMFLPFWLSFQETKCNDTFLTYGLSPTNWPWTNKHKWQRWMYL